MFDRPFSEKPFQIFSPDEIKILDSKLIPEIESFTELKTNLSRLKFIFNDGIHNKSMSWRKKISDALKPSDEIIQKGLHRYLEAADRLQQPRKIMRHQKKLASGRIYEGEVNIYKAFWDNCYEALIHAFLAATSKLAFGAYNPDNAKSLSYGLLHFKKNILPNIDLPVKKTDLAKETIDKVIQGIHYKSSLENCFLITDKTVELERETLRDVVRRYLKLLDLKSAFETEPHYAKYVHIRPSILIELATLIDENYGTVKEYLTHEKNKWLKNSDLEAILNQCLSVLKNKKEEIFSVAIFQEKLFKTFGSDDFIEILHSLVKNIGTGLLPTESFFEFEEKQIVKLVKYMDHSETAKLISSDDRRSWRLKYISAFARDAGISINFGIKISLNQLAKWKNQLKNDICDKVESQKEKDILSTEYVQLIQADTIQFLQIPAFMLPFFLEQNLSEKDSVYQYFIKGYQERKPFFELNKYRNTLDFLLRQINSRVELDVLLTFNVDKEYKHAQFFLTRGPQGAHQNFLQLIKAIECFNTVYPRELIQLEQAKKSCRNELHRILLNCYEDTILLSQTKFIKNVKRILDYWTPKISAYLSQKDNYVDCMKLPAIHSLDRLIEIAAITLDNKNFHRNTREARL